MLFHFWNIEARDLNSTIVLQNDLAIVIITFKKY